MKAVYIVLVIVLAAATLGCVGKKGLEPSTKTPSTPAPTSQPSNAVTETEVLDTGNDLTTMDTMFEESNLDLSLSEVSADTFT